MTSFTDAARGKREKRLIKAERGNKNKQEEWKWRKEDA